MAKYTSADVPFVFLDGINIIGVVTNLEDSGLEGEFEDTTPLGSGFRKSEYLGLTTSKVAMEAYYDDSPASPGPASSGYILQSSNWMASGPDRYLSFGISGNVIGKDFVGATVKQSSFKRLVEVGKFHRGNVDFVVNEYRSGLMVANLAARTTGASTTNTDFGAAATAAAAGAVVFFQCGPVTGTPTSLTVLVEHSDDGSTDWETVATTGAVAAASIPYGMRVPFTGTVKRYMRTTWSWVDGTAPSWSGAVGVALT